MDSWHASIALAFGTLSGAALGALGAGGLISRVLIRVSLMGVPVTAAPATSLAIVGANAAMGTTNHLRLGQSLLKTGLVCGVCGVAGAVTSAWLTHRLAGALVLFSLLMLVGA